MSQRMFGSVGGATVQPWNCSNASTMSSVSLRKSRTNVFSFSGMDPVEAREGLDRGQPDQRLVHVHRVQQRLVEAGLELLGDDQDAVLGARELLGRAGSRESRSCSPR